MKNNQKNMEFLLSVLASVRSSEVIQRRQRKARIGIGFALLCAVLYIAFQIISNLTNAFAYIQRSDWWGFIIFVWPVVALLLAFPGFRREVWQWLAIPGKAPALREQLHNEQLVPPATAQPAPLQGDDLPLAPTHIAPLKRWEATMTVSIIFGLFFLLLGLGGAWGLALLLTQPDFNFQPGSDVPFAEFIFDVAGLALFILLLCGLGIGPLIAAWRAPRGASVTADDWGLRWRKGGWGQHSRAALAWHEVQGFYVITYQGKKAGVYNAYLLDGRDTAFLWRLIPRSTPAELAASERLARLIITRTRLPLCDLSGLLIAAVNEDQPATPVGAQTDIHQV